jgi:hypothetical protein
MWLKVEKEYTDSMLITYTGLILLRKGRRLIKIDLPEVWKI